jgi:riboflavin kinase / FMN adenylyltransferase
LQGSRPCSKRAGVSSRLHHSIASYHAVSPALVVIGNFDGVHRGHQRVLLTACELARQAELEPIVLTFEPHPAEVLSGVKAGRLTTLERKTELLLRLDPSLTIVVEPFSEALAHMAPQAFAEQVLADGLSTKRVVVGENFRFGHQRRGDLALLSKLGDELGFEATSHDLVGDAAGVYSSTRIRAALRTGDVAAASSLLGRPHALTGRVVSGDRRGRQLGFPTANLAEVLEVVPGRGVYAVAVDLGRGTGFSRLGLGAMNVGVRPTVDAGAAIEVHLLDFEGDLYDRMLRVHLIARLRDELRFDGLAALQAQLSTDVARAREELCTLAPSADAHGAWF